MLTAGNRVEVALGEDMPPSTSPGRLPLSVADEDNAVPSS